jgi:hypothetical protein
VLRYLQSKGIPPSSANVRAALEANARDPGVIPGLRNDTAATEAEDQAAMRGRSGPSVGQSGNAAGRVEGGGNSATPPDRSQAPDTAKTTSAQPGYTETGIPQMPGEGDLPGSGIWPALLGGAGAGGLGAYILRDRFGGTSPSVGISPSATEAELETAKIGRPGIYGGLPDTSTGPFVQSGQGSAMAEPPPSPMEQAMLRATQPATGVPSVGDSVPPMPDIGPVPQPRIPAGPGSAVLPPDLGAPPPQTIPSGPLTQTLPQNMPENAPRVPMPNRVGAAPTPADFYHPSWNTIRGPLARSILGHGR